MSLQTSLSMDKGNLVFLKLWMMLVCDMAEGKIIADFTVNANNDHEGSFKQFFTSSQGLQAENDWRLLNHKVDGCKNG